MRNELKGVLHDRARIFQTGLPRPVVLLGLLFLLVPVVWNFVVAVQGEHIARALISVFGLLVFFLGVSGFLVVQPNEAAVLVLFGKYAGSVKKNGWWWANPFTRKIKISLRAHNFDGDKLKVNDITGNPIEIAAVVVWRVADTYAAIPIRSAMRSSVSCRSALDALA